MEGRFSKFSLFLIKWDWIFIKQVVNFDTASADRAAFGLVVRSTAELEDRVYAYCLAASFAASAAVVSGKCPDLVESAMASTEYHGPSSNLDVNSGKSIGDCHVTRLQACVGEAKRVFLHRLCQLICQVSCLVENPEDLLVDVEPEELLGFDLEQLFNANALAMSSKRFVCFLFCNRFLFCYIKDFLKINFFNVMKNNLNFENNFF